MKNTLLMTVLCGAMSYIGHAMAASDDVPLPPDVTIVEPKSELPPSIAGFSGKWAGTFVGPGDRIAHVLVVESITAGGFIAVYANSDSLTSDGRVKAGWRRVSGIVEPGKLRAILGSATVVYELDSDRELTATYTNQRGFASKATMKRAQ